MGAREHRATVAKTRQAVLEYADRASGRRVQEILKDAARRLEKGIADGDFTGDYTLAKKRLLLKQVRQATVQLARDLKDHVVAESVDAATDSGKRLVEQIGAAEKRFKGISAPLPIDEASVMDAAAEGAESSVLSRLVDSGHDAAPGILRRYGTQVVGHFERRIQVGMLAGESMDEIADGLVEKSPFLQGAPRFWAERIARTEVHGAYARAAHKGMKKAHEQLGDVCRIAVSTFDLRTACLPGSTPITGGVVRAVFRRWYEGRLLHLVAESGRDLSATPNHPVLTRRGWIRAGQLRLGDELVCDDWQEQAGTARYEDVADRPPTLAQIFDSFPDARRERRRGAEPDFHGDGRDGYVDVLRPDGELRLGGLASFQEPRTKEIFAPPNHSMFCRKCSALLGFDASEQRNGLRGTSDLDTAIAEAFINDALRDSERAPYLFQRLSAGVSESDRVRVDRRVVAGMPNSLEAILSRDGLASSESSFRDLLAYVPDVGIHRCRRSLERETGQVKFDRLVSIEVDASFRGHVFNLSTTDGYYSANGVYTSNCDSYNVHGQIRRVAEPFEHVRDDGGSDHFMTPPDRPQDRGIVVVHRLSWGKPPAEWRPLPIAKVVAAYAKKGKKFPGRPKMSTIPLSAFRVLQESDQSEDESDVPGSDAKRAPRGS